MGVMKALFHFATCGREHEKYSANTVDENFNLLNSKFCYSLTVFTIISPL